MPNPEPGATTRRLLACVEAFAHEEEGALGHDDWPALAALLERELAVLRRLGDGIDPAAAEDARNLAQARKLRERYAALESRIEAARTRAAAELAELDRSGRRLREVRGAYGARAA
jgi:hypothetical protein